MGGREPDRRRGRSCAGPTTTAARTCCTCSEPSNRTTCSCGASGSARRPGSCATTRPPRCTTATRWTTCTTTRRRARRPAPDADRHDADDQLVLRVGVQLVRGAAPGRAVEPDRLRQRLPRLAGDVAALPLPVARRGQPAVVDLLRGDEAADAGQPRLGAVLRDRRHRRARTPRSSAPTRRSPGSGSRPTSSSRSARPTSPTSTRSCREFFGDDIALDAVRQKVGVAVPDARGRRVHRAVLVTDPARGAPTRPPWPAVSADDDVEARVAAGTRDRVEREVSVVRWGDYGTPVLVFPTAGGDAEEIERFHLVGACSRADRGRAGEALLASTASTGGRCSPAKVTPGRQAWIQRQFFEFIRHEVVPAIRADCLIRRHRADRRRRVDRGVQRARRACACTRTCSGPRSA